MKGQTLEVTVIKVNKKRGNIVVSRKELLEGEQNEKRSKTLEHLEEGSVLTGVVKNLTDMARLSISAASTACCTSPICRGAGSRTRAIWSTLATDSGEGAEVRQR